MKTPKIVERLVNEISQPDEDELGERNLPLEYYELRELAKARVLLKSSFKSHLFIYGLVNIFLIILNFLGGLQPLDSFTYIWSLWSILGWGLILLAHGMILVAMNIPNLEYRIFIIVSVILIYIIGFLAYINYYIIVKDESHQVWWYWPGIAIILFIAGYAWIVFYSENKDRFYTRVSAEMDHLKAQMQKHKDEEETTIKQDQNSHHTAK
ncbi:MAG: 2TM domain-containing protein [Promethearchaeota archaeon]